MSVFLDLVADATSLVVAVLTILFTLSYWLFFNWKKTAPGRALLQAFVSFSAIIVLVFPGIWFPGYAGRDIIRLISWTFVMVSLIRLLWNLYKHWIEEPADIEVPLKDKYKNKEMQ